MSGLKTIRIRIDFFPIRLFSYVFEEENIAIIFWTSISIIGKNVVNMVSSDVNSIMILRSGQRVDRETITLSYSR
jgi:hypothetical protein